MNTIITQEARKALLAGRRHHWRFRVVEMGGAWYYENVPDPEVGLDRIKVLKDAGVPIKTYWLAHEAPRLLPAPKPEPKPEPKNDFKITPQILPDMGKLFQFCLLILGMILIDPALIVELEDGTLIEVMRWYD